MKMIERIKGKTILKIEHTGYDKGIIIEFDDGSSINIRSKSIIEYNFQEGPDDDLRRDICKCGEIIIWDIDNNIVSCSNCKTTFKVESDSQLIYWLEESFENKNLWKTPAK